MCLLAARLSLFHCFGPAVKRSEGGEEADELGVVGEWAKSGGTGWRAACLLAWRPAGAVSSLWLCAKRRRCGRWVRGAVGGWVKSGWVGGGLRKPKNSPNRSFRLIGFGNKHGHHYRRQSGFL